MREEEFTLTAYIVAIGLFVVMVLLNGCFPAYRQFAGETTASYESPDGRKIFFQTNQDQQGFRAKAKVDPATGKITDIDISVQKAGTNETASNAAAEAQKDNAATIRELTSTIAPAATEIIKGAIAGGLVGGGPGAGVGAVAGAAKAANKAAATPTPPPAQ
jgi:hypothetical protein